MYNNKITTISYAILACHEAKELKELLQILNLGKRPIDEIVVLLDKNNYDKCILSYIYDNVDIVEFNSLDGDFSQQKNKLISLCTKNYIFNLDADEYVSIMECKYIHKILELNLNVDLFYLPRINTVSGITLDHVNKWNWNITKNDDFKNKLFLDQEYKFDIFLYIKLLKHYNYIIQENEKYIEYYEPIINYPDIQGRLWKNNNKIKWVNKVHEKLVGMENVSRMPVHIIHKKEINKQVYQNEFYDTILN